MSTLWSTIKISCLGVGALTCTLLCQDTASAQKAKQPSQTQPQPSKVTPARVGTVKQNRTLSNYTPQYASPANPFNPTTQGQIQNQLYYQGLNNQQFNTVTGILGNNLAPLVGNNSGIYGGGLYGGPSINLNGLLASQNVFGPSSFGGMPLVTSGQPFTALTGRGQPMFAGPQGMMMNYMGVNPMMMSGMNPMMVGGMNPMMNPMMMGGMNPMMNPMAMGGMNPMMGMGGMNPMMMGGMGGMNPMMGMYGPAGMNPLMMSMYGPGGMNPMMMGAGGMGGLTPAAGMGGAMLPAGF
jgi:hypothetical protein